MDIALNFGFHPSAPAWHLPSRGGFIAPAAQRFFGRCPQNDTYILLFVVALLLSLHARRVRDAAPYDLLLSDRTQDSTLHYNIITRGIIATVLGNTSGEGGMTVKIREIMTNRVVRIHPEECVSVAARQLANNNIGAMPVCSNDGRVIGLVTDRDIVTRCLAAGRSPEKTRVREVMTGSVVSAAPDMDAAAAASLMGHKQIRRLPVVEDGKLCGMVSLADLANREETSFDAVDALSTISSNVL